ncbi:MAG: hypothetical protein R3F49_11470 [Planctomycetota bacterium]
MRPQLRFHTALALLLIASRAFAQAGDAHIVLRIGDLLPTGETVLNIFDPQIVDDGRWSAAVIVSGTPIIGAARDGLVVDGQLVLAEGDFLLTGEQIESVSEHDLGPNGGLVAVLTVRAPGAVTNEQVVWRNGAVLVREGPISGAGVPIGAELYQIFDFDLNGPYGAMNATLKVGGVSRTCTLAYDFTTGSATPTITLIGLQGQVLAPFTDPYDFAYTGRGLHTDSAGAVAFYGAVTASSGLQRCAWVDGLNVFLEGGPSPAPNSLWEGTYGAQLVHAEGGNYAVAARIERLSNGSISSVIYRNGQAVAVVGAPLNGVLGLQVRPYDATSISMADSGELFFVVPLGSLTTTSYTALMADSEMLIRTGQSAASGLTITSFIPQQGSTIDASPDGNYCIFRAYVSSGPEALCVLERSVGQPTACVSAPNSTGVRGRLLGSGFSYVAANDLVVTAVDLPPNAFGYLNTSRTAGFVAQPGGSVGNLCLGGSIGRYVANVQSSGAVGVIATTIDLNSMPQPLGSQPVVAGQGWAFQLWHRDAGPSGAVSNWSDPLLVRFR